MDAVQSTQGQAASLSGSSKLIQVEEEAHNSNPLDDLLTTIIGENNSKQVVSNGKMNGRKNFICCAMKCKCNAIATV